MVVTQDDRAEQSLVRMFVIERQPVCTCVLAHTVTDAIVDLRHQMAFLDVQHLVKAVRDMKTQTGLGL